MACCAFPLSNRIIILLRQAIDKSMEIGECYAPNILAGIEEQSESKIPAGVSNPHRLTPDELMELADYSIRLWILKAAIRRYGQIDPKIFG